MNESKKSAIKQQKIMLDGGFTCPNRDGRVGRGGCTFCLCESFNPNYCRRHKSIRDQILAGKEFFKGKYHNMKYLAYFQAYSSTYAPLDVLSERYDEALADEDVVGLVVATRPDCLDDSVLSLLVSIRERGYSVGIELGCESFYDRTLSRVNRGHTSAESIAAIKLCHSYSIPVTVHLMIGLPGESRDDILAQADIINTLPVSSLKLHQLQILSGTAIAKEWTERPDEFLDFTFEDYAELIADFVCRLRSDIRIERYASSAPMDMLLAPRFGVKPSMVEKRIKVLLARK
ncbi:MAG: TIGR01212 family radical SAM protein [Bacteroidaceae bacterium]|nr:TIGR01212 family radical SAM protein [Bacteroidaceae bacterium]